MYFDSFDHTVWPYLFILMAGVLPTAVWRWIGVVLVGNISDDSEWLVLVRCVATALVAAVIAQLIFQPTGALATFPFEVRVGAAVLGFVAFLMFGRRLFVAIVAAEVALLTGYALF